VELAPTPDALVRPWRKATVVATTVAVVELVLLVVAGISLLGRHLAHTAQPAAPKRAAATPHRTAVVRARPAPIGTPRLARSATAVVVLNANGRPGAAASEASIVSARGYRIGHVGNAPTSGVAQSVVMYRPGYRAEGARLAHDLGIELFAPLDGLTPASLGRAQLAVLVGRA
jgi:LytR cell envelope-related transcriptional attenuator